MQRKFTIVIYNCVTCICTTLKSDNNIRCFRQHICYFTFSFVAPVGSDNRSYHIFILAFMAFSRKYLPKLNSITYTL